MEYNQEISNSEKLTYSTIRIETTYSNGSSGSGTGFIMNFCTLPSGEAIPCLVTNSHVIEGAVQGRIILSYHTGDEHFDDSRHQGVVIPNFQSGWIKHPDESVDLCILQLTNLFEQLANAGKVPLYSPMSLSAIPSQDQINTLSAMEDIVMIGYPNGLWDSYNNKPLIRKGITATHIKKDYLNKKEFVIDAACFPGSSGSPVFLLNEGSYYSNGKLYSGNRTYLIGILYAGPRISVHGEIEVEDIPTAQSGTSVSQHMINLGYVIKSERLHAFESILLKML